MVADSGSGIYGQNAVKALRGGFHNFAGAITQANDQLLGMLAPLPDHEAGGYFTQGQPQILPNLPNIMGANKSGDHGAISHNSSVKGER